MSERTARTVASVLVIAADPAIETLVGELIAFAGHRPVYDAAEGAAGESVRRVRPNVVLLDASLPKPVVSACLLAAEEVGTRTILMSGRASKGELTASVDVDSVPFFVLPGGPKPLASLIDRTLEQPVGPVITVPEGGRTGVHPAMCAALASVNRARALVLHAQVALAENRLLHGEITEQSNAAKLSLLALRAAVVDFARQLRAADVPETRGISLVASAIRDCAAIVGAEESTAALLEESADWTREVYRAA